MICSPLRMLTEATDLLPSGIPENKYNQFRDVQGWMAHLLYMCLNERKHLKTKRGLKSADIYKHSLPPAMVINDIQTWHTYLVMYIVMFHEANWTNMDFSVFPKLPDHTLLDLARHQFFEGVDISIITKHFRLLSRERKLLKECAVRMTPCK